jgi:predicted transcriptional regulator
MSGTPELHSRSINKSASQLVVVSSTGEKAIGIVTLHDIFRLQSQLADAK